MSGVVVFVNAPLNPWRVTPTTWAPCSHATTASPLALIAAVMLLALIPAALTVLSTLVLPFGSRATMSISLSRHRAHRVNPRDDAVARPVEDDDRRACWGFECPSTDSGARRSRACRPHAGPPGSCWAILPASRRLHCHSRRRRVTVPHRSCRRNGRARATQQRPPCPEAPAAAPAAPSQRLGRSSDDASGLLQVRVSKSLGEAWDYARHPPKSTGSEPGRQARYARL